MLLTQEAEAGNPPLPQSTTAARIRYEEQCGWGEERVSLSLGLEGAGGGKGADGITQHQKQPLTLPVKS